MTHEMVKEWTKRASTQMNRMHGGGRGAPGPDPLRRLPLPLEIGWKVPDHGRQRLPQEILLDRVEGEKTFFSPDVFILKMLSF